MSSRTYYIDVNGGFLDSSLPNVRRKAIDHLWDNRDRQFVAIYTTARKTKEVGRVIYTGSYPIFVWKPNRKPRIPLRRDGNIYPYRN